MLVEKGTTFFLDPGADWPLARSLEVFRLPRGPVGIRSATGVCQRVRDASFPPQRGGHLTRAPPLSQIPVFVLGLHQLLPSFLPASSSNHMSSTHIIHPHYSYSSLSTFLIDPFSPTLTHCTATEFALQARHRMLSCDVCFGLVGCRAGLVPVVLVSHRSCASWLCAWNLHGRREKPHSFSGFE